MDRIPNFNVHLITHPISLIALGIVAVLVLAALWAVLPPMVVILLIVLVVVAVAAGIVVVIKYPELRMENEHLYNYATDQFRTFRGDVAQAPPSQAGAPEDTTEAADEELDSLRVKEYGDNRGLFLVHDWRPSRKQGQVADITIRLQEHRDTSTRLSLLRQELRRVVLQPQARTDPAGLRGHGERTALPN
jgi:hypothetical protein